MPLKLFIVLFFISVTQSSYAKRLICPKDQTMYDKIILEKARKHKVDPALVHAVIKQESCYSLKAVSHAGAQGLMQLIPATARRFGVKNVFNASQNIDGGTRYLAWLLKRFDGNIRYVLAGYNAGEGRVDEYNGVPPFKETQKYVVKVMNNFREFKGLNRDYHKKEKRLTKHKPTYQVAKAKKKTPLKKINKKRILLAKKSKKPKIVKTKPDYSPSTRIRSLTLASVSKPADGYTRIRSKKRGEI